MPQKMNKVGEINKSNQGYMMTIIKYYDYHNIEIMFNDERNTVVHADYSAFQKGKVKNPYHKTLFNLGYIGDTLTVDSNGKRKESYYSWKRMLKRCYDEQSKYNTYKDCTVCEEWLCYANFEKWYNENYYEIDGERTELDKDILLKGNKVYSPITCVFVPKNINALFEKSNKIRNSFYIGVRQHSKYKNKYMAECSDGHNKNKYLGIFDNPKEAFYAYKTHKENLIKEIAEKYKESIPNKLYEAMFNYKVEMTD